MTTICVDTLSGSIHNILGVAPDGWPSIDCSELLHALDEFLDILWLLTVHLLLRFSPEVKVQRNQIGRVRWPADSSTATDNTPFEFLEKKLHGCIGAVRKFAAAYGSSTIRRVAENVVKRARQCLDANGGHFQHLI